MADAPHQPVNRALTFRLTNRHQNNAAHGPGRMRIPLPDGGGCYPRTDTCSLAMASILMKTAQTWSAREAGLRRLLFLRER